MLRNVNIRYTSILSIKQFLNNRRRTCYQLYVDGTEFQTSALFSRFEITKEDLEAGEEVATCPSCSLIVRVIYDPEDFDQDEEKLAKDVKSLTIAQTN